MSTLLLWGEKRGGKEKKGERGARTRLCPTGCDDDFRLKLLFPAPQKEGKGEGGPRPANTNPIQHGRKVGGKVPPVTRNIRGGGKKRKKRGRGKGRVERSSFLRRKGASRYCPMFFGPEKTTRTEKGGGGKGKGKKWGAEEGARSSRLFQFFRQSRGKEKGKGEKFAGIKVKGRTPNPEFAAAAEQFLGPLFFGKKKK